MSTDLVPTKPGGLTLPQLKTLEDYLKLGDVLAKSGMFNDTRDAAKAVVKILAGAEMGFGPLASMAGVDFIEGKPSIGAHLRAAAIKRSPKYDYKVHERTDAACELEFFERVGSNKESLGRLRYTLAEAHAKKWHVTRTGTVKDPWAKTPANMLFARALTDGYKTFCPDLTGGVLTYDADELDRPGEVIDAEFSVTPPEPGGPNGAAPSATQPPAQANGPSAPPAPHPGPAPESVARIDEQQRAELSRLVQESGVGAQALLGRYQIHGIVQLPAIHFEDAKRWLSERIRPLNAEQPRPSFITREQFDALFAKIKDAPMFAMALLQTAGVERWGLLPQHLYPLVYGIAAQKDFDLDTWRREKIGGRTIVQLSGEERDAALRELAGVAPMGA